MSTTEIATTAAKRPTALGLMASRLSLEPARLMAVLKSTVFAACRNDEELAALVVVANEYGLNPLLKEIYAFPAKGGGIVPMIPVDGWVKMVNNHPQMDGVEFETLNDDKGALEAITCRIFRKDRNRPIVVTEYLSECKRNTDPWKMEHRMLRHKALMQCARYAFGFSGVHDEDEATDIGMRDVTPATAPRAEAIDPFKTIEAPTQEEAPTVPAPEQPAPAAAPTDAVAAHVISVDAVGDEYLVTIKGAKKQIAMVAKDSGIAKKAESLIGLAAWVNFEQVGGKMVLTGITLKEEEGDLL